MMRVAGCDPSTSTTGLAHQDGWLSSFRPRQLKKTDPPSARSARLNDIVFEFTNALQRHPPFPDLIVFEGYSLGGSRGYASSYLAEVGGVLRRRAYELGIEWTEVPPSQLKKYATGDGSSKTDKKRMKTAAERDCSGLGAPANGDEADAYWLRQIAVDHFVLPDVTCLFAAELATVRAQIRGGIRWPIEGGNE